MKLSKSWNSHLISYTVLINNFFFSILWKQVSKRVWKVQYLRRWFFINFDTILRKKSFSFYLKSLLGVKKFVLKRKKNFFFLSCFRFSFGFDSQIFKPTDTQILKLITNPNPPPPPSIRLPPPTCLPPPRPPEYFWGGLSCTSVVYFNRLLGAARTQKLVETYHLTISSI